MIQLNQNIRELQKFNISVKDLLFLLNDLKVGQILRGKVVEILDNKEFLMLINGQKILTQSKLNLKEGDTLLLRVQSTKPSINLQFIGVEESSNPNNIPESNVIRIFNLDSDELNQDIIAALVKNRLPINKQEINNLFKEFNSILLKISNIRIGAETNQEVLDILKYIDESNIPLSDENILNTILYLKKNNLPLNTSVILKTIVYLNQKQDPGEDLNELLKLIDKSDPALKDFSDRIKNILNEKFSIQDAADKIGMNYEKNILDIIKLGDKPLLKNEEKQSQNIEVKQSPKPGEKQPLFLEDNLKQVMILLNGKIDENPKLENSEKLKEIAFRIMNNLDMQQILNSEKTKPDNNLIFQFPVLMGEEYKTLELKINREGVSGGKYKNQGSNFSLSLNMSELGNVGAYGNLNENRLSCTFNLESPKYCSLFESDLDDLQQSLKESGLIVSSLKVHSASDFVKTVSEQIENKEKVSLIDRVV
jgi:hypothetical protein